MISALYLFGKEASLKLYIFQILVFIGFFLAGYLFPFPAPPAIHLTLLHTVIQVTRVYIFHFIPPAPEVFWGKI